MNRQFRFQKPRFFIILGLVFVLLATSASWVFAQAVVPIPGPALTMNVVAVNDGAGDQTDPHLSGDWVAYMDYSIHGIRFQNVDLGTVSDRIIPHLDSEYDYFPEIDGNTIGFLRSGSGSERTYLVQIDPFGNPGPAIAVPLTNSYYHARLAVGGDTIAYVEWPGYYAYPYDNTADIWLASVSDPTGPAIRLTNDALFNDTYPAVSPDGNAVIWLKCYNNTCNVWRAERTMGAWNAPEQVTSDPVNMYQPETNGPVTVYSSNADGDYKVRWSVKDDSGAYVESVLDLPGVQVNPKIAGSFIAFQSRVTASSQSDIWLYDLATNRLFQLTDTPIAEYLTDISTGPGGLVRVAYTQWKEVGPYNYEYDAYVLSALVPPLDTDTTPPSVSVTGVSEGAEYVLGAVPQAGCSTTDDGSGVQTEASLNLTGGTALGVGSFTAACSGAVDNAGNAADPVSVNYTVTFQSAGFTSPVDNNKMNIAKAGQTIPLKWRITDANGSPITGLTSVTVSVANLACDAGETSNLVEEYSTGSSGLQNLGDGYYQFNWKTPSTYASSCKTLQLNLGEGSPRTAEFQFRK